MRKVRRRLLVVIALVVVIAAVGFVILGVIPAASDPVLAPDAIVVGAQSKANGANLALNFPPMVTPSDNPITPDKQDLGRLLFFDPILSAKHDMSCASCHHPDLGFSNGKPTGIGADGQPLTRNVPTLYEVAYKDKLFLDGRAESLEAQLRTPMTAPNEMAAIPDTVVADLKTIPAYQALFAKAFPNQADPVTFTNVTYAIATFERSLVAHNSPYDRYAQGDSSALTPSQRRGLVLFRSAATRCYACHSGALLTNNKFDVTGVPGLDGTLNDPGRGAITSQAADMDAFKVPTLRNVALTAPYMHNGKFATLDEVVAFYVKGGGTGMNIKVPNQNPLIYPFDLSDQEQHDLVNFLYALTDESTRPAIPDSVPSGLPVVKPIDNPVRAVVNTVNTGGTSVTNRAPTTLTVTPDVSIQSVVDKAVSGDTIEIQYGTYNERVVIDQNNITVRGIPDAKGNWPILDGLRKFSDGISATGDNFTAEQLSIKNYVGNGIVVDGANGVVLRDLIIENMSLYGIYPVHSTNVLVERVKATQVADAGIYAGQSQGIVIRNNELYGNVVGIEVENSVSAEVYNNHSYNNTAGITVHLLPGLPSKVSQKTQVHDNVIENNNLKNFGRSGSVVSLVPTGTGLLILGSDDVDVYNNNIHDNATGGIGVLSTADFFPVDQLDMGPNPERVHLYDNTYAHNGYQPDKALTKLGVNGADVIWDASNWDNVFDDSGISSFPPLLPHSTWPVVARRAYWQAIHFVASKLF